jgi:hypothetical protein
MNRAKNYGTAIVLAHLVVNIIHGASHRELRIDLDPIEMLFVVCVILICPLVAMGLLWTSYKQTGLVLLTLSMFGSLVFGAYKHFVAMGPDHVSQRTADAWGMAFVISAYLLLLTEGIGTYTGLFFLYKKGSA